MEKGKGLGALGQQHNIRLLLVHSGTPLSQAVFKQSLSPLPLPAVSQPSQFRSLSLSQRHLRVVLTEAATKDDLPRLVESFLLSPPDTCILPRSPKARTSTFWAAARLLRLSTGGARPAGKSCRLRALCRGGLVGLWQHAALGGPPVGELSPAKSQNFLCLAASYTFFPKSNCPDTQYAGNRPLVVLLQEGSRTGSQMLGPPVNCRIPVNG